MKKYKVAKNIAGIHITHGKFTKQKEKNINHIKVFQFLVILLSGIFMYKFMKETFKDKDIGLVSSIMYICMPYFICDVFVRMAYAEIPVFVFMPIIMRL